MSRCRTSVRQDLTAAPLLRDPKLTLSGILCLTFSHMTTTFFYLIFFCSFFSSKIFASDGLAGISSYEGSTERIVGFGEGIVGGGDLKSLKLNPSVCSICSLCASPNGVCIIYCNTRLNAVEILLPSNQVGHYIYTISILFFWKRLPLTWRVLVCSCWRPYMHSCNLQYHPRSNISLTCNLQF